MKRILSLLITSVVLIFVDIKADDLKYYFSGDVSFDSRIPTPEEFLGYAIGSRITEHSKINEYYKKLDELSDRTELIEIGKSHESRPIYVLAISSPENLRNLNSIKALRQDVRKGLKVNSPLIIFLGNTVQGNILCFGLHYNPLHQLGISW